MVQIVSRASWGARPPKSTPRKITTPTPELWLHHTASPTGYEARVRAIQTFHMDTRGWNDIAYSFLINHEGTIYEGRGAGIAGGHTAGHNTISHAICLMGNYDNDTPTVAAMRSIVELARHGYSEGWWREGFTGGHRDASGASTSCPGRNLHSQISTLNQSINLKEEDMPLTTAEKNEIADLTASRVLSRQLSDPTSNPTIPRTVGWFIAQGYGLGSRAANAAETSASQTTRAKLIAAVSAGAVAGASAGQIVDELVKRLGGG